MACDLTPALGAPGLEVWPRAWGGRGPRRLLARTAQTATLREGEQCFYRGN